MEICVRYPASFIPQPGFTDLVVKITIKRNGGVFGAQQREV
jgi:hypothetical protein